MESRLTTVKPTWVLAFTAVSKNKFSSLALSSLPSTPLLLVGLTPVMVFLPLHTSRVVLLEFLLQLPPATVLSLSDLTPQ